MKTSQFFKRVQLTLRAEGALPSLRAVLAASAVILGLGVAQAAPVSSPTDTQLDSPTNAETARMAGSTGGKVLDKAVQIGVSTGSRNVDLLLELHRSDAEGGNKPANGQAENLKSALPGSKSSQAQSQIQAQPGNPTPLPSPSQNALLGPDNAGAQLRAELFKAKRDVLGEGSARPESAYGESRRLRAEALERNVNTRSGDVEALSLLSLRVMQFFRDNRTELLVSLAILVLVGAGLKAYSRRV